MKAYQAVVLFSSLSAFVAADFPAPGTTVTFYRDAGCNEDASSNAKQAQLLPSKNDDCISGTASLGWPQSADGIQIAYFTGDGLPSDCNLAVLQQANIQPGDCGTAIEVINGGTTGSCKKGKLPVKGGLAMCCGGQGNGCTDVPSPGKRDVRGNSTIPQSSVKDVTEIKRSAPLQRLGKRSCTFNKSNGPYTSRGRQEIVTDGVSCPSGGAACSIQNSGSVTVGSSNSFGVSDSVTVGGDFFVTVQDSVSFSYMYTYSESKTQSQSYTVGVPAGESGYVTFTPTVSCVDGTFSGDCQWSTSQGTACIPLYVGGGSSGTEQGVYSFVEEQ